MLFSERTATASATSSLVYGSPRISAARSMTFGDVITATWFSRYRVGFQKIDSSVAGGAVRPGIREQHEALGLVHGGRARRQEVPDDRCEQGSADDQVLEAPERCKEAWLVFDGWPVLSRRHRHFTVSMRFHTVVQARGSRCRTGSTR